MNDETTKRRAWLEQRKNHIGASDCAAILGVSPHKTAFDVYHSKVGGVSEDDKDWLAFGRDVEGAIANMYQHKTGRKVIDEGGTTIRRHQTFEWLGATLDRLTDMSKNDVTDPDIDAALKNVIGPLEIKHVSGFDVTPEQWVTDPPLHYQIQLQIQMACTGTYRGCLAAMFPGYRLVHVDIDRNNDFLSEVYPLLFDFWRRVKNKNPPPITSHKSLDLVKRMFGRDEGKSVYLKDDTLILARDWDDAKREARAATKRAKELEAELRLTMEDASSGEFSDGSLLCRKTINRKGYTVEPTSYDQISWKKSKK